MTLADKVYQTVEPLPEPLIQEVLDFASFLQHREETLTWKNLMQAQGTSLADWDNAEDEVWNHVPPV